MMVAWLLPLQVAPPLIVAGWVAIAAALLIGGRRLAAWTLEWAADALALVAMILALSVVVPLTRLVVADSALVPIPLLNGDTLALASLVAYGALRVKLSRSRREGELIGALAGALAVYIPSVAVIDLVSAVTGTGMSFEDRQRLGQVALSVLWAALGVGVLAAGLGLRSLTVRLFGLGLLAMVTVKVFVVDLAALDVAFRVLSFIGLGILLVGGGWLYLRFEGRTGTQDVS